MPWSNIPWAALVGLVLLPWNKFSAFVVKYNLFIPAFILSFLLGWILGNEF